MVPSPSSTASGVSRTGAGALRTQPGAIMRHLPPASMGWVMVSEYCPSACSSMTHSLGHSAPSPNVEKSTASGA